MSYMIKLIAPKFLLRAFCALSIIFFLGHSLKYASSLSGAFIDYYTYSHILIEGKSFERVYDPSFFNTTIATLTQQPIKGFANQPPTNAFALVCLAWLNPVPAKLIYSVLSILAFIGSVLILLVLYDVSPTSDIGIGLISLSFLWRPVYVNTSNSQIFTIILFLFCLSLLALKKGKQGLSTFAFTIPFLIKGFGVIIFLWLTITKRWKALFFSVLLIISCLAISIPLFGLEA
ncbi:MAG: DUF2029 domain-containing protein, partial [Ignavibacteriales bacterium]|nr:DUF2029 domain-containing protein [Ignavibacteriales bacterium]